MTEMPMRADARRNRAQILTAAEQAFAEEGVSVPLDEIARRAGVGAGTIYRHFPTKDALFDAVLQSRIDNLVGDAHALGDTADPGEAFFRLMFRMIDYGIAKKDLVDALSSSGRAGTTTAVGKARLRKAGGALLRQAQVAGAIRDDATISDVLAIVSGIVLAAHQAGGDRRLGKRMFDLMCDGLRPR